MLIEFRVENHRSIRDEQVLSMEAAPIGDPNDGRPRKIAKHPNKLLPVVAIYGANGSGKSNVLSAIAYMGEAVIHSQRFWSPSDGVPRDPFAWGKKRNEHSLYEVELIIEGIRYQYGFLCNDTVVVEEWIYAWPNGKKQAWLEREGKKFKFGEHLKGENKLIEGVTRSNALYLSAAAQLRHAQLWPLYSWFDSIQTINLALGARSVRRFHLRQSRLHRWVDRFLEPSGESRPKTLIDEDRSKTSLDQLKAMLQAADIGIVDVKRIRDEVHGSGRTHPRYRFELKHKSESDDAWLPLEEESGGTRKLFGLALPIIQTLRNGSVLLVDELESSMHPMLADLIVRQFNDPEINKLNAQLIFSTHDTNLLGTLVGEPALRRDQVWLTEKDPHGATVLYPLTDFKPRKDENIERGYIQGRYGAIPFLGDFRFPSGAIE